MQANFFMVQIMVLWRSIVSVVIQYHVMRVETFMVFVIAHVPPWIGRTKT